MIKKNDRQMISTRIRNAGAAALLMGTVLFSVQNMLADDDEANRFSGDAIGIYLNNIPQPTPSPVVVAEAGPLPSFGGKDDATVDHFSLFDGAVRCDHADSHVEGKDDHSDSHSHVAHFHLRFTGSDGSVHTVDADNVDVHVRVQVKNDEDEDEDEDEAGDEDSEFHEDIHSHVDGLVVDGEKIETHPDFRRVLTFSGFMVIVNDVDETEADDLDEVAATGLTVMVSGDMVAEVCKVEANVVSEEEGESDEVTGSGSIPGESGGTAFFSLSGGPNGQLTFMDTGAGVNVVSTSLTSSTQVDTTTKQLVYACLINGVAGTATCVVQDLGLGGAGGDTFSISLSTGYSVSGTLTSGDIVFLN
jgi:hypothetical protein